MRRGENRITRRKTSRSKDENQQQTQPTYDAESGNRARATLVGGERSHHCAIPALPEESSTKYLFCEFMKRVLTSVPTTFDQLCRFIFEASPRSLGSVMPMERLAQ